MLTDGHPSQAYRIFSPHTLAIVRPYEGSQASILAAIAATEDARAVGLSKRTQLEPQEGMLFVFPFSGRPAFTLAETNVDLDVIFLRSLYQASDSELLAQVTQVSPTMARAAAPVIPRDVIDLVLEVNYGAAHALGISAGSIVSIRAM